MDGVEWVWHVLPDRLAEWETFSFPRGAKSDIARIIHGGLPLLTISGSWTNGKWRKWDTQYDEHAALASMTKRGETKKTYLTYELS